MQEKRIGTERDSATCMIHLAITLVNITDNMFILIQFVFPVYVGL